MKKNNSQRVNLLPEKGLINSESKLDRAKGLNLSNKEQLFMINQIHGDSGKL